MLKVSQGQSEGIQSCRRLPHFFLQHLHWHVLGKG